MGDSLVLLFSEHLIIKTTLNSQAKISYKATFNIMESWNGLSWMWWCLCYCKKDIQIVNIT